MKRTPAPVTIFVFALLALTLLGCCPPDVIRREAIAPSVNALTGRLDTFLDEATARGELDPGEAETLKGESALLRSLVASPEVQPPTGPPEPSGQ